jgi:arabinogalactan oligomer/maltooligosaccharide transport system substrate-binding protein
MSRNLKLGGALSALVLALLACTPAAPTSPAPGSPDGSPAPGTPAGPTITPEPTAPPAETACEGGGSGGDLTGELTLWHSYGSGAGTEAQALSQALDVVCGENPGLRVDVVGLDFGSLFNVYRLQASNGDPDLFVAPNDSMWELAEATLLENIADRIDQDSFSDLAIEGSSYTTAAGEDGIWQVPESLKAVALYYNGDSVSEPPATTDDLLTAVEGGMSLGLLQGIYHNFGWWGAFGGELMDDSGRCVASDTGVADAYQYMADLKAAGATFYPDYDDMAEAFKAGNLDAIVDGPWAAGGYVTDVENLGVAAMPAGPDGPALPLTGVDGYNINPYGSNVDLAVDFANRMVEPDIQQTYADVAYHLPSDPSVPPSDNEVSAQFAEAVQSGALRPQRQELGAFWDNFGNALNQVIEEDADPATAVDEACQAMNAANGFD